jgi:hypothetical protein
MDGVNVWITLWIYLIPLNYKHRKIKMAYFILCVFYYNKKVIQNGQSGVYTKEHLVVLVFHEQISTALFWSSILSH